MLPIKRRINKETFNLVMKDGVFVSLNGVYLKYTVKKDPSPSLFAFVVPKKVKKTSIGRHLLKRKMTAVVEKVILNIKNGYFIIIFAKEGVCTLPYNEIEKEILNLLKKANLLS